MRTAIPILLALALSGFVPGTAGAQSDSAKVTLKEESYISGSKVFLGDIANIEGPHAAALARVELCSAPQPGASKRVDASLLVSRLRYVGFRDEEVAIEGPDQTRVTTMHLEVTADMLEEELMRYLEDAMPWDTANTVVEASAPPRLVVVPDGEVSFRWNAHPQYRFMGQGTIKGEILVDGSLEETVNCKANIEPYIDVLIAARGVKRGQPLRGMQLRRERRAYTQFREEPFTDPAQLAGYMARTDIRAGEVITSRDVAPLEVIQRNQVVAVEVVSGSLRVRSRARALRDGAAGDVLVLENPETRERLQGIVQRDGTVVIP